MTKTVKECAELFRVLQPGRDPRRHARLAMWVEELPEGLALADLTPEHIRSVMLARKHARMTAGKPWSGPDQNRFTAALKSLIKWARAEFLLPHTFVSPFAGMPLARENPGRLRFLDADERKRLLAAAELSRWALMPLLIRTLLVTGLRCGALRELTWGDVDLKAEPPCLRIKRTKAGRQHVAPLTPDLAQRFAAARRIGTEPDMLVFCAARDPYKPRDWRETWIRCRDKAGLGKDVSPHTLRHTSASMLAQQGVGLQEVADHLDHSSLQMTRRYSHLTVQGRAGTVVKVFGGEL